VLLNAAGAIAASGRARNLREGLAVATEAVDSGAAGSRLEELIAFTRAKAAA
jgi:anthranilate phosphoribosyltransferase